jgi:putative NIF3 family GTP cyclohydrolase 1 type 2
MPGGTADALADRLGLRSVEPFGGDRDTGMPEIGRVGDLEATLAVLDARVSDVFGRAGLRVTGDSRARIDRVAVIPGSGARFIEAAAGIAEALVTGDVSHHRGVLAADLGLAIVDPGHTATERPGMEALIGLVKQSAGADVVDLTGHDPRTWG